MKTIKFLFLLILLPLAMHAQTGMLQTRFYITGSLAIGRGERGFSDTSAWLQLGKDTTAKGAILPRVILDSIKTNKRGVFVYDLKDSVLYHFDSNKRVRYMTYRDTTFIKTLISGSTARFDTVYFKQGGNGFGTVGALGTKDSNALNIKTFDTTRMTITAKGDVGIGVAPTQGKLQVNGFVGADGLKLTSYSSSINGMPGIYKHTAYGFVSIGSPGSSYDHMLVNNPTQGLSVMAVPRNTANTRWFGQMVISKSGNTDALLQVENSEREVQVSLGNDYTTKLFMYVGRNQLYSSGYVGMSVGSSYLGTNTSILLKTGNVVVDNSKLLVNTMTDNGNVLNVNGSIYTNSTLQTGQPSNNGAGIIKIGKVITGASVTLQTSSFLEVEIDGNIYKLAIVN